MSIAHLATLSGFLLLLLLSLSTHVPYAESLVVPQELPSILSLIYSNIPPIKKGTDSRLGFGFRLGNHADFQILLELGPQKNTRPIGENAESENNFNKRQVSKAQRNYLLRQQLQQLQQQQQQQQLSSTTERAAAGSWLESWSNNMNAQHQNKEAISNNKKKSKPKLSQTTAKKQFEKTAAPMPTLVPPQSLQQLQLLYQMATTSSEAPVTTSTPATATAITNSNLPHITTPTPFAGGRLNLGGPAGFTPRPPEETVLQSIVELQDTKKSKSEITRELMNVSLEEGE